MFGAREFEFTDVIVIAKINNEFIYKKPVYDTGYLKISSRRKQSYYNIQFGLTAIPETSEYLTELFENAYGLVVTINHQNYFLPLRTVEHVRVNAYLPNYYIDGIYNDINITSKVNVINDAFLCKEESAPPLKPIKKFDAHWLSSFKTFIKESEICVLDMQKFEETERKIE